jgi:hypothetical protein
LTVTGDLATAVAVEEPPADVKVREVNTGEGFAFEVEGEFRVGSQVIEIANESDQPHFMELVRSPGPLTMDQLVTLFEMEEGATPPPGVPNPDEFELAAYAAVQSRGTTQWLAADLEPGYYMIACFVPDPTKGGVPHAFEGMVDIIVIGEVGTPTA